MFRLRTVVDPVRPPACVRDHMTARQVIQPTYCSSSQSATRELYHVGSNGASIRHCPSTHSAKFKGNYSPQQRARPLSPQRTPADHTTVTHRAAIFELDPNRQTVCHA